MADSSRVEVLRRRRDELQARDDVVSYARRVAQGRADLVRRELAERVDGAASLDGDLRSGLREVLADRLLGGGDRPPRPAEEFSADPLSEELDEQCAANGFGRIDELDPDGLEALLVALDDFEQRVSTERRELFAALDAVTDDLVEVLRLANSPVEDE